jgi:hypothetical protein
MYTCNFAYVAAGRPAAAREAFCSPDRGERGEAEGIKWVIRSETDFMFVLHRTQLLNLGDIENVKKVQAAYKVPTLSHFLGELAPAAPPSIELSEG